MDDIWIRPATAGDALPAAEVMIAARRAGLADGSIPQGIHDDDDVRRWMASVVFPKCETWVAENGDGGAVGILVLREGWIDHLYLAPGSTGRGLGSRFIALAKQRRPDGLMLWTFRSNLGAQRFYERYAFVAVERTDGSANEERAPDVRYAWPPPG